MLPSPQDENPPSLRAQRNLEGSRGLPGKVRVGPLSQVGVEQKKTFLWGLSQLGVQKERSLLRELVRRQRGSMWGVTGHEEQPPACAHRPSHSPGSNQMSLKVRVAAIEKFHLPPISDIMNYTRTKVSPSVISQLF